jgi:hypothetical protein
LQWSAYSSSAAAAAAMAEAGGAFVTRSFKRMLNDAPGRKYSALQTALKAYLGSFSFLHSFLHFRAPNLKTLEWNECKNISLGGDNYLGFNDVSSVLIPSAERKPELLPPPAVHHEEAAAVADEMYGFLTTCLCFLQLGFSRCTWQIWWVCIPFF